MFAVFATALVAGCTGTSTSAHRALAAQPTHSSSRPAAATPTTAARAARPTLLVDRLEGVRDARQVVAVTASGYRSSHAVLTAFARTASGWRQVFGPWKARIGYKGFARPGRKREGDGRTPTGTFGFQFMFGVAPNPGVRYPYRPALATSRWDDDPRSAHYNEWVDSRSGNPGRSPEAMRQLPSYRYGAVIAYNVGRRPGAGSAIFLHVAHTGATSGCVSLPQSELLGVLRWLDPAQSPRIVMGTTSAVEH